MFTYPEAKSVVVCGDIHGDFKGVVFKLCIQYGLTDTLLIVAGDCGFGFEKPGYYELVYNQIAGRLRKANNWVAFVRGDGQDLRGIRMDSAEGQRHFGGNEMRSGYPRISLDNF